MMRLALLAVLLAGCGSCGKGALTTVATNNTEFKVDHIFDVDGCRIYRFVDGGYYHYFANCPGSTVTGLQSCGKNCWRHDDVPTVGQ